MRPIRTAAVLGAGVMGAQIAGHLANVGIKTYLLDRPVEGNRNQLAEAAKEKLLTIKPAPLFSSEAVSLIEVGNVEDDLCVLQEVDWIIEAIVESLPHKQALLDQVEKVWRPGTIVSSNTSGLSITRLVEGRSSAFQQHVLGTHFFNPPRYMRLLEIIPTPYTLPTITAKMKAFAEEVLGKGVVIAKDTPNFIANRIGIYGIQVTLEAMERLGLSIEEVDQVTGKSLGRSPSATFRTLDLVGLDTYVRVVQNAQQHLNSEEEKRILTLPPYISQLVEKGWLGRKTGRGFYEKKANELLVLDLSAMNYRSPKIVTSLSIEQAQQAPTLEEKVRALVYGTDWAGQLAWWITKKLLLYTAWHLEEIADDLINVDQAMKWGFQWEVGPFELWDAIGVEKSVARMKQEGENIPAWVEEMLARGHHRFYRQKQFFTVHGVYQSFSDHPKAISLKEWKEKVNRIKGNSGASLIDLGDDILCLEFHSPKQAIGVDMIQMMQAAVEEVAARYRGLVIAGSGPHFCVGANLMLMLMYAQNQAWDEIEFIIRQFQQATSSLKKLDRPVVVAPYGMTLGGGAEICLPADHIQAAAETYMGLVEVGVGLIPAGGGVKEMLFRLQENEAPHDPLSLLSGVKSLFQTIGQAKVSSSAVEARKYHFLRRGDQVTMNPDFLLYDAKKAALHLADHYQPLREKCIPVVGQSGYAALQLGAYDLWQSRRISKYDYHIACKLAYVLAGGNVPAGTEVSESYLLDLEREAFLSLIGEPKTQERMLYMLKTGKPLRN